MTRSPAWWLARGREVRLGEVPHRVREQLRMRRDRGRGVADPPPGPLPRWPVPAGLDEVARGAVASAEAGILREGFELLGAWIAPGARSRWDVDPASGERWPRVHAFDLDLRARDPKPSWELHRLQHLQVLALGSEAAGRAALDDLASWLAENPPWTGIGWASGLEVACRAVSLLRVCDALRERFPADLAAALRRSLQAHGVWLARYPSAGSSAGNHALAESAALALLGATTGLPASAAWLAQGREGVMATLPALVLADGSGAEMSVRYLAFALEWALVARLVTPLGPELDERLARGARFLGALLGANGHAPRIGDDDGGVVLRQALAEDGYVASVAGATAGAVGRPDLVPTSWRPDLRASLLGVPDVPAAGRGAARPGTFPIGGLTVLGSRRLRVTVDHGPLGFPAQAAHGHADALAIWVQADGRPLVVGCGTYRYVGGGEGRAWERGTAAHATVVVDGRAQSVPFDDPFLWRTRARATLDAAHLTDAGGHVTAHHDGYARLGVLHTRTVSLDGASLRVVDLLEGSGEHHLLWPLHFAADLVVERVEGLAWTVSRGATPVARIAAGVEGVVIVGGPSRPGPGWRAPRYGELVPAPTLALATRAELPYRHELTITALP